MHYSIEKMMKEHDDISRMLKVVRKICLTIMEGSEVPVEDMKQIADFIKNYADIYHHGKEEKYLFPEMVEELGTVAEKLITHGMLVEHDQGRNFKMEMESALVEYEREKSAEEKLNIVAEAMGYVHLLERHIAKENAVVYTFAERELSEKALEKIDALTEVFEKENVETNDYYNGMLEKLEEKYLG